MLCFAALAFPVGAVAFFAHGLVVGLYYLRRIGIILHEPPEGRGYKAFHNVFLVHPVELAHYFGHERCYLLLVYLGALQAVDDVEQLFGADVLG